MGQLKKGPESVQTGALFFHRPMGGGYHQTLYQKNNPGYQDRGVL